MTFNSDGSVSIGAVSNFSNSGDCSNSAFLNGASGWGGPKAGNSYFPEPANYGALPPDQTTPFLQVFDNIYPGGNPTVSILSELPTRNGRRDGKLWGWGWDE